jgi:uncharacterized repeat protein (TIGR03803 family)
MLLSFPDLRCLWFEAGENCSLGGSAMGFGIRKMACVAVAFCAASLSSRAQVIGDGVNFQTLVSFDQTTGKIPIWPPIQGTDGNFYGSTTSGGPTNPEPCNGYGCGTIFEVTPTGELTTLAALDGSTGSSAQIALLGTDGNFYGATGPFSDSNGVIFKMLPDASITTLYTFCASPSCVSEGFLAGALVEANDGYFYGTTLGGGASGDGTFFQLNPAGELTTLLNFDSAARPTTLIESSDGDFYGTTGYGANDDGTIVRITPQGRLFTLHTFTGEDGKSPYGALIQATDGNFYGTTYTGGKNDPSNCEEAGCGTIFKMTPWGTLTTIYSFCAKAACVDGQWPSVGLIQGSDGNFYGTTQAGGLYNYGTIFKITPNGMLTTLHSFDNTDGSGLYAGLTQGTDGNFYGNAPYGLSGYGTLFKLSLKLQPFVKLLPTSGQEGTAVTILGNNLQDTSSVTFNRTPATFTVVSNTEITAIVPNGATSGIVEVKSPFILKSNVPFWVPIEHY